MFMWETGIIILLSLFLMVFLMFTFREFVEDTTAAKLESLFVVERIWVPLGVTAVLFLIGGAVSYTHLCRKIKPLCWEEICWM